MQKHVGEVLLANARIDCMLFKRITTQETLELMALDKTQYYGFKLHFLELVNIRDGSGLCRVRFLIYCQVK